MALVVVGTLVAVGWCTAVHDILRETVVWWKTLLGYKMQEVRELKNGEQVDSAERVDSVLHTPEHAHVSKTVLPRGFIGGRE